MACLSFWLVEMSNLFPIIYDLTGFARYPETVHRGPVRLLLHGASPALLLHRVAVLAGFLGLG